MFESIKLSVIVPALDAASTLDATLKAITTSRLPRNVYELIVVDDASTDGSASVAARYADTVVRLRGSPSGPAYARNRGAEQARGEVLLFIDADVVVRPDTLSRMLELLDDQPSLAAVSAVYDEFPSAPDFLSQYWNLLLHFGEQRHAGRCARFSSACGAIRRTTLLSIGMFDEWRFANPCLEGLELGQRLLEAGYSVVVNHDLQITHSKHWSLRSVLRDVWDRSSVVARSLGYQRMNAAAPSELVFTLTRAATPVLAVIGIVAVSAAFVPEPHPATKFVIGLFAIVLANLPIHRFYSRVRGLGFALAAAPLHLFVQLLGGAALCAGWLQRGAIGDSVPDARTQAYAEVGLETWPPVRRRP